LAFFHECLLDIGTIYVWSTILTARGVNNSTLSTVIVTHLSHFHEDMTNV
jgi:hypothetical protein